MTPSGPVDVVAVVAALTAQGRTVATAESLTAGLLAARIADVPGASAVLRGGVVAYATDLKASLLNVDADLLARVGPVHPDVAAAMALGARTRCGADIGVATTGVAGPGPADGHDAGTFLVALSWDQGTRVAQFHEGGLRNHVRLTAVDCAVTMLAELLGTFTSNSPGATSDN